MGEWDHYLKERGRKEEGPLVLGCERQSVAFLVYINVYTELTVRQPKTVGKRVFDGEMRSKLTV